jgi:hypothetical protein
MPASTIPPLLIKPPRILRIVNRPPKVSPERAPQRTPVSRHAAPAEIDAPREPVGEQNAAEPLAQHAADWFAAKTNHRARATDRHTPAAANAAVPGLSNTARR